ncbi:MAG TPA: hypothetical protein V6C88_00810 [Chroococcidiopsis sp.]
MTCTIDRQITKPPRLRQFQIALLIALLSVAIAVRLPGLTHRAIWGDEAITLMETAGHPIPAWPKVPTPAEVIQVQIFQGTPTLGKIADDLRRTDVHPPLYYWCLALWRRWFGFSLETARAFSLLCSVATVLTLYLSLRICKLQNPLIPTLVYALSSISVNAGHDARDYALASLWVVAGVLFALLADRAGNFRWDGNPHTPQRCAVYTTAMGLCCGAAFQTNYLALFPTSVTLLWFAISLWPRSRRLALAGPLLSIAIWLAGWPILSTQLGARTGQAVGFRGVWADLSQLWLANMQMIAAPARASQMQLPTVCVGLLFVALLVITGFQLIKHRANPSRRPLALMVALALVPSMGLFALNVIANKHLSSARYIMLAAPFLSVCLAYGISTLRFSMRYLGTMLLVLLIGLQLVAINWGDESTYLQGGTNLRSFAQTVNASSTSPLVMVSRGFDYGRGGQGALIYELSPPTIAVSVGNNSTLDELPFSLEPYADVWLALFPKFSKSGGATILSSLRQSPDYVEVPVERESYDWRSSVYHFKSRRSPQS